MVPLFDSTNRFGLGAPSRAAAGRQALVAAEMLAPTNEQLSVNASQVSAISSASVAAFPRFANTRGDDGDGTTKTCRKAPQFKEFTRPSNRQHFRDYSMPRAD